MSSILKALQRLEEEKSLHAAERPRHIPHDILKPERPAGVMPRWVWLLVGAATTSIVTLSAALYWNSANKGAPTASQPLTAVMATTTPQPVMSRPMDNPPTKKTAPLSQGAMARQKEKTASSLPLAGAQQIPTPQAAPPPPKPLKAEPDKKNAAISHPPVRSEPAFLLSGIAWNKDSADRLAIINGQPTVTGTVISGYLVKEILPDKVILSRDGRAFELFIGKNSTQD